VPAARLQVLYLAFEITKYRQPASRVFGRVFQGILNIAFKSREQAIFSLSEKAHTPGLQNLCSGNFFHYSTL
jgi:hypothetical protein